MATKSKFRSTGKNRDSYLVLALDFPLASIKSEGHLAEAQRVIDGLLTRGTLDEGTEMYLDADMLRHLMEAKNVSQIQLSRDTKLPKSSISEVLAGKKPFSRQMLRKLADYFDVDFSILATNI